MFNMFESQAPLDPTPRNCLAVSLLYCMASDGEIDPEETLAVLREFAAFVAEPGASGIKAVPDLAGKRLMLASRTADRTLLRDLGAHHGLEFPTDAPAGVAGKKTVALVPVEEADVATGASTRWRW